VQLVDPAVAAVAQLGPLLTSLGEKPHADCDRQLQPLQQSRICVTGCADSFARAAAHWLGQEPQVEQVHLQP
jgi:glutamate racemase